MAGYVRYCWAIALVLLCTLLIAESFACGGHPILRRIRARRQRNHAPAVVVVPVPPHSSADPTAHGDEVAGEGVLPKRLGNAPVVIYPSRPIVAAGQAPPSFQTERRPYPWGYFGARPDPVHAWNLDYFSKDKFDSVRYPGR